MIDREPSRNGGAEALRGRTRRAGIGCRDQKLSPRAKLPLSQALLVKSAEFWLRLGESNAALGELQKLPNGAQQHPWTRAVSHVASLPFGRQMK
jgi:hypothetical protein